MTNAKSDPDATLWQAAEAVAREHLNRTSGVPPKKLDPYAPGLTGAFTATLANDRYEYVLVQDGKVIADRNQAALERYLRWLRFLEKQTLTADSLASLLDLCSMLPNTRAYGAEPDSFYRGETGAGTRLNPTLKWGKKDATLSLYYLDRSPSHGGPQHGSPPIWKFTLRVSPEYKVAWEPKPQKV